MAADEQCIYNMEQQLFSLCDFWLISSLKGWMEHFNSSEQKAVGMQSSHECCFLIVMANNAFHCWEPIFNLWNRLKYFIFMKQSLLKGRHWGHLKYSAKTKRYQSVITNHCSLLSCSVRKAGATSHASCSFGNLWRSLHKTVMIDWTSMLITVFRLHSVSLRPAKWQPCLQINCDL